MMTAEDKSTAEEAPQTAMKVGEVTLEWMKKELELSESRERDYRKETVGVIKLYEGAKHETDQYNILFSNTDTMQPALYNSTPRPVVQRRFKVGEDTIAKAGSTLMQRLIAYYVGDEDPEYDSFDNLMSEAVLGALLASRGATQFRYDAKIKKVEPAAKAAEEAAETPAEEGAEPPDPLEEIEHECVYGEAIPWNSLLYGYAKRWSKVPWVAICHLMTPEEFKENFPGVKIDMEALKKSYGDAADTSDKATGDAGKSDGTGAIDKHEVAGVVLIPVYEVWHKAERKVLFVSQFSDDWLKPPQDDPLGLRGFYPMPEPLDFMQRLSSMVPVPLYRMYKEQAEELNTITLRIQKITRAVKIRGAYDGNMAEVSKILQAGDNDMIPIPDAAMLYGVGGTLDKAIWLMPIDKLVGVLQQLYTQREQIKRIIFEITGLADIMRGSSQASETLGAQEIKNQWGTLRLKRLQKRVQKYCRDCMRLIGEIGISKLQPETIRAVTNSDLPSQQQQQIAQMAVQQAQMAQPPQQPKPEDLAVLQMPSFESVVQMLKDDLTRSYKIDIETNSTIEAEATEDKQDVIEVLNALGQFLTGVGPLIQEGVMPFEAAKTMMMTIVRKFKLGQEFEDQLMQMQPPQPKPEEQAPQEDPAVVAAKGEVEKAKVQAEMQKIQLEMIRDKQAHEDKMAEMAMKRELIAAQTQAAMAKALMPPPTPAQPNGRSASPKPAPRKP